MSLADLTHAGILPATRPDLLAEAAEEAVRASERPQLILQPRGTRDGGPQHFAKSVRTGIRVSDLRNSVGSVGDILAGLYPEGIARLWGSTPTSQANNEKVRALRDRRVGDHVFFYTGNSFIARAKVVHLLTSSAIARAVWGSDKEGNTWSHIMALDEFEEFAQPIPALDILAELQVPRPLRMLTLRSADDYAHVAHQLPAAGRQSQLPQWAALPSSPRTTRMTRAELLTRLETLRTHHNTVSGRPSRHQPLTLLWAIARIAAGEPRLAPWTTFQSEVGPLLSEYGLPSSKITPEYPFWHLRGSGLWEVRGLDEEPSSMPAVKVLSDTQPEAGLSAEAAELLQGPLTRLEAMLVLRNRYLHDIDLQSLLDRLGMTGYTTADGLEESVADERATTTTVPERAAGGTRRRETTSSSPVRNTAIVSRVKEFYGSRCQVCDTLLQYKRKPYSEAAHIRGLGKPHYGPDELHNLLCLCANHHVLFDGLEIYIDADGVVRETHGDRSLGPLSRHPDHPIDEKYIDYHRALCMLNR
ncbi:HNH endonuclease [Kitasatospora sp. NPDC048286]|uniref:HNH endonuclease n=1 Tax=Kitasatospora sp. NPDC048286 TaxID=3364047 RepID=UPI003720A1BA